MSVYGLITISVLKNHYVCLEMFFGQLYLLSDLLHLL